MMEVTKDPFLWWLTLESLADRDKLSTSSDTLDLRGLASGPLVRMESVLAGEPEQHIDCIGKYFLDDNILLSYRQPPPASPGTVWSQISACPICGHSPSAGPGNRSSNKKKLSCECVRRKIFVMAIKTNINASPVSTLGLLVPGSLHKLSSSSSNRLELPSPANT